MSSSSSPTALKWWIACEMRKLREQAGVTREEAAKAIRVSVGNIGHIEVGRWLPKPMELERLLEIYGVPERNEAFQELRDRAKRGRDWWDGLEGTLFEGFNLFLGFESSSVRIDTWDPIVIPGLFQTADYVAAIAKGSSPDQPAVKIEKIVEVRIARQREVFKETSNVVINSVFSEAALRMLAGSPAIMRAQLDHLLSMSNRPNVNMQLLPFSSGANAGVDGYFTIFSPPPELGRDHGLAYVESRLQGYYYQKEEQVKQYQMAMRYLSEQALTPEDTSVFIRDIAKELEQ